MKTRTFTFLGALVLMAVMNVPLAFAQHDHNQGDPSNMMQECRRHHPEMASLVDQVSKTLVDGREAGSLEEMRAAIDKAYSQLAEMKEHMSACPMSEAKTPEQSNQRMKCMSGGQQSERKGSSSK